MEDHIDLDKLDKGTKLVIETHHSNYYAEIIQGRKVHLTGGTLKDGGVRFPEPVVAVLYGCTPNQLHFWRSQIVKGMKLEIHFDNEDERSLLTSGIKEVHITAPDGSWSYAMGWKDQNEHSGSPDN